MSVLFLVFIFTQDGDLWWVLFFGLCSDSKNFRFCSQQTSLESFLGLFLSWNT